jgi:hypothetical protein
LQEATQVQQFPATLLGKQSPATLLQLRHLLCCKHGSEIACMTHTWFMRDAGCLMRSFTTERSFQFPYRSAALTSMMTTVDVEVLFATPGIVVSTVALLT